MPPAWGAVLLVAVIVWEVSEMLFWIRLIRRYPVVVGREALIGLPVTATTVCRPEGRFGCGARVGRQAAAREHNRVKCLLSKTSTGSP